MKEKNIRIVNLKKVFFIGVLGLLAWCSGCRKGKNIPDVSSLSGAFELVRFDRALFANVEDTASLWEVRQVYPVMWELYFTRIVPVSGTPGTPPGEEEILDYIRDPRMQWIYDTTRVTYDQIPDLEEGFYSAFQFLQYYFPNVEIPRLYMMISDFSYFPFIFEDVDGVDGIGISLEMFMGGTFPYRRFVGNHPAFSAYLTRSYNRDHIVKKSLEVLVDDIAGFPPGDRLIDQMVHNGKKLVILENLLPYTQDTILMEYSAEQLDWCKANARNIWAFLLQEDLLYSSDRIRIQKLIFHSPNVPGMPPEAPGRVANWVGWQIVKAYMERFPGVSLQQLIDLTDAQDILTESRFKPRN